MVTNPVFVRLLRDQDSWHAFLSNPRLRWHFGVSVVSRVVAQGHSLDYSRWQLILIFAHDLVVNISLLIHSVLTGRGTTTATKHLARIARARISSVAHAGFGCLIRKWNSGYYT